MVIGKKKIKNLFLKHTFQKLDFVIKNLEHTKNQLDLIASITLS